MLFTKNNKARRDIATQLIAALKQSLVLSPNQTSLVGFDKPEIKEYLKQSVFGFAPSIIDVYLSTLTKGDLSNFKKKLESYSPGHKSPKIQLIQLQDLLSESEWELGYKQRVRGHVVNSEPSEAQLREKLRWHDVAVWQMYYNLFGNEFSEMPNREKFIFANVLKTCTEVDQKRALFLIGLLYANNLPKYN